MLREKENQLLVMVSTAMPGCGISSQLELCLVCWWLVEIPGAAPSLLGPCLWRGLPCSPQCAPSHPAVLSWLCSLQEDDESSQCSADFDLSLPDNGFMSKNEVIRSKVSRLTERLRKRYPSNNFGNCTGCASTFSVLKKRRSCSNCGNSFCSRCCSFKVPKAVMGATAPEAQKETVFVCALCNQVLIK